MAAILLVMGIAQIALIRQVGILHARLTPMRALHQDTDVQPGEIISLDHPFWEAISAQGHSRIVVAFISPTCRACAPLLPALNATTKSALRDGETMVVVADADDSRAQEYRRSKRIISPIMGVRGALEANRIPGAPYLVVAEGNGRVIRAGVVNSGEQIDWLLDRARGAEASAVRGGADEESASHA
jgi:hypothetical protein